VDSGRYDATVIPKPQGSYYIKQNKLRNIYSLDDALFPQHHGIAAAKGNASLIYQVDEGLKILKASGKYQEIYNRWFGVYELSISTRSTRWILVGAGIVAFLLLASLGFMYALRRRVRQRTDALIIFNAQFDGL